MMKCLVVRTAGLASERFQLKGVVTTEEAHAFTSID